jgi:hypothetical protein
MYNDKVENGLSKLLHRGLKSSEDNSALPTSDCIPYHDYVVFLPCGHCCPEVFADCRACKLEYPNTASRPGHPTDEDCFCHYCVESELTENLSDSSREAAQRLIEEKQSESEFDVFLCHNNEDKEEVKYIGERLKDIGLLPWLDVWEIRPGTPWLQQLQEVLKSIKSAAIFVGANGIGPWQQKEIEALLINFDKRGCPVIPSILKNCREQPSLPIFLERLHYVDFRKDNPDPFKQLRFGITGKRAN